MNISSIDDSTINSEDDITKNTANKICDSLMQLMDSLNQQLETETSLLREGKLIEANEIKDEKSRLSNDYIQAMKHAQTLTKQLIHLVPEKVNTLRNEHERFKSILQINMAALAVARDVSQDLISTVSEAMAAKEAPKTYHRYGQIASPQRNSNSAGLAINKEL